MSSWSIARCRECGHEERRYSNVKHCHNCGGPLERPTPEQATQARLRLARQIAERAKLWSAHDPVLADLIRRWETEH